MRGQAYDGTPLQSGTEEAHTNLTGYAHHFSIAGLREAVVVARRFVDDDNNRSRSYVEYDCRDLYSMEPYIGCRRVYAMGGLDNGDCHVLRPQTNLLTGAAGDVEFQTPAGSSDGDRVLLGFIEGSKNRAVILGVLTHSFSKYGAKISDGDRRLIVHNGSRLEIDKDGQLLVTHKSGTTLKMLTNGDCEVNPAGALLLGGATAIPNDGALNGSAIDPFTGSTHFALGNASAKVFTKK